MDRGELLLGLTELLHECRSKVARARKLQLRWVSHGKDPGQMEGQKRMEKFWSSMSDTLEETLKILSKEKT